MKILNRGFIAVTPKAKFIEEVMNHKKQQEIFVPDTPEASIYLIEEDFWDDEVILKKYFKNLIKAEINQLEPEGNIETKHIDFDSFQDYFDFSMGNIVFDLENKPIEGITADVSD